jgi:hypothetical protein
LNASQKHYNSSLSGAKEAVFSEGLKAGIAKTETGHGGFALKWQIAAGLV